MTMALLSPSLANGSVARVWQEGKEIASDICEGGFDAVMAMVRDLSAEHHIDRWLVDATGFAGVVVSQAIADAGLPVARIVPGSET